MLHIFFQSNEVTSSNAMELEGLKRGLKYLQERGINVETFISDRHRSIAKYMREQQPDIDHFYDVWHVAKGKSICLFIYILALKIHKKLFMDSS